MYNIQVKEEKPNMNRRKVLEIGLSLTNCYKCNKEINPNIDLHYVEDFYNSTTNKMDVRIECFPRHTGEDF